MQISQSIAELIIGQITQTSCSAVFKLLYPQGFSC